MPKFNVRVRRHIETSRVHEPRGNPDLRWERTETDYRTSYVVVEAETKAEARAAAEKAAFERWDDLEWVEAAPPAREEKTTFHVEPLEEGAAS